MTIFECDGCGKQERMRSGRKPHDWYQRNERESDTELHACSRECIERVAEKHGGTRVVLPL